MGLSSYANSLPKLTCLFCSKYEEKWSVHAFKSNWIGERDAWQGEDGRFNCNRKPLVLNSYKLARGNLKGPFEHCTWYLRTRSYLNDAFQNSMLCVGVDISYVSAVDTNKTTY